MKKAAFVIKADGSIVDLPLRKPTLEELQAAVGGYIELLWCMWLGQPAMMFLDEEGKLKHKETNYKATHIAHTSGIAANDRVVGDVVLLVGRDVWPD